MCLPVAKQNNFVEDPNRLLQEKRFSTFTAQMKYVVDLHVLRSSYTILSTH